MLRSWIGDESINEYVTVRIYKSVRNKGPVPVGVYFHGGGFCCGDLDSEDPFCRSLVERRRCVIVSVGYRLAPEHKAPAQTEDAMAAWSWVCVSCRCLVILLESLRLTSFLDSPYGMHLFWAVIARVISLLAKVLEVVWL